MKHFLRIGLPLLVLAGLIAGLALPVAAADQPQAPVTAKWKAPVNTVGGEVTAIAADKTSFTVKPRAGDPVTIKVDANTKYYKTNPPALPQNLEQLKERGQQRAEAMKEKAMARLDALKERIKNLPNQRGLGNKGQTPAPQATPTPADLDAAFLARIEKTTQPASFGDIAVGDIVLVKTMPNENLAKYVVITKRLPIARVEGTITAVSANTITITPTGGQPLVLNWDKDTRFTLQGAITIQAGQTATAVYNTETMKASVISVKVA
ncbi:MAG: DUF5666 domain-containing protein [Chloroflexota bacterium]